MESLDLGKNGIKVNKERKSIITEIVLLSIFGTFWVLGLVFCILGMCAFNIDPVTLNPIYMAQKTMGSIFGLGLIDFRIFGTVILLVSMVLIIGILYYYANKYDTVKITKNRREKMMKELLEQNAFSVTKEDKAVPTLKEDKDIPTTEQTKAKIM